MSMTEVVQPELLDQVLEKFGLSARPEVDTEGLRTVYNAWCESVSFDNVQKRVYMAENGSGPLPGIEPAEFLQNLVTDGTGGTCWPSSGGLWALLDGLGFDARRVSGNMIVPVELDSPNHGSTAVLIDGQTLLADSSILNHAPIPLVEGEDSSTDVALNETRVEWVGDTWQVHWLPGHGRDELTMRLDGPGIGETRSFDFWAHRSEVSRGSSLFNDALYIRRSVPDGVRTIGRGALISIGPGGEVEVSELDHDTRNAALVETFGLSEEIVSRVPPDGEGFALG